MDHAFLAELSRLLAGPDIEVVRFNFPYMSKRAGWQTQTAGQATRAAGALAPDGEGVCSSSAVSGRQVDGWADGGRTLSGWRGRDECCRIAHSRVSFPPPANPDRWRGDVLKQIKTPTLLLQGSAILSAPVPNWLIFLLTRRIGPLADRW